MYVRVTSFLDRVALSLSHIARTVMVGYLYAQTSLGSN